MLSVVGTGFDLTAARDDAYSRIAGIRLPGSHFRTDIGLANEPNAHYVLVSTREHGNSEGPVEFRSYRIVDGNVTEEDVAIEESRG